MVYQESGAKECRETGDHEACGALWWFVRTNPKHPFIGKASEDLKAGYVKLDVLDWEEIDKNACKNPTAYYDCDDLREHFATFPDCKHKEEIAEIVQGSSARIEAMRRVAEAQGEREEAQSGDTAEPPHKRVRQRRTYRITHGGKRKHRRK